MNAADTLLEALRAGEVARVDTLLDANPALAEARTQEGVSLLLVALYHGKLEVVAALRRRRQSLDLFEAAALGEQRELERALSQAPAVDALSPDGFTALGLAAFFGHAALVSFLLNSGARANVPSENAMRVAPLHSAVARGSTDCTRLLLDAGADADARQAGGYTPLHQAAARGDREVAKLLLQHGASLEAKTAEGETPLDLAKAKGEQAIVSLLRAHTRTAR